LEGYWEIVGESADDLDGTIVGYYLHFLCNGDGTGSLMLIWLFEEDRWSWSISAEGILNIFRQSDNALVQELIYVVNEGNLILTNALEDRSSTFVQIAESEFMAALATKKLDGDWEYSSGESILFFGGTDDLIFRYRYKRIGVTEVLSRDENGHFSSTNRLGSANISIDGLIHAEVQFGSSYEFEYTLIGRTLTITDSNGNTRVYTRKT
jgi:hypothetical protein